MKGEAMKGQAMPNAHTIRVGEFAVHPIWYRHWLELRYRLLAAGILGLLCSFPYPAFVAGSIDFLHQSGKLVVELNDAQNLLASMDPEKLIVWGVHVHVVLASSIFAVFVCLTNMAASILPRTTPLALPVSGWVVDVTALLARWASVSAVALLTTALDALVLAIRGNPVPGREMIATWAVLCLLWLPVLAMFSASCLSPSSAALFAFCAPLIAFLWAWRFLRRILLHPESEWLAAAVAVTIGVAIFVATRPFARWRER